MWARRSGKWTEEEQALLQSVMDDVHKQFIEAVAEGRGARTWRRCRPWPTVESLPAGKPKLQSLWMNLVILKMPSSLRRMWPELRASRKSLSRVGDFRSGS